MNTNTPIPPFLDAPEQNSARWTAVACHPAHSVVVEASAGSGKTWLLTARLFRLLLSGARPDQILAITFTRKAAQEMQERLLALLEECALAPDHILNEILTQRGAQATAQNCARARALAGEVLTNARGVTINTFHGWFTSLCQLSPLSSGFSRQSEPTEQVAFWMDQAMDAYTQTVLMQPDARAEELQALNTLSAVLDRQGMRKVLVQALSNRVACDLVRLNPCAPSLHAVFDLTANSNWPVALLAQAEFKSTVRLVIQGLAAGTSVQQDKANAMQIALEAVQAEGAGEDAWAVFRDTWLTSAGKPRSFGKPTKAQTSCASFDALAFQEACEATQTAVLQAELRAQDQLDLRCTEALYVLMEPLFQTYARLKTEHGLCDFDDLEATALRMLMDDEQRAYMQQKLDARVHHLLLDEFQDTNPVQWNILRLWLEDYSTPERPTVFLVGDPKQSIYRFRRAEARLFEQAKCWLQTHFQAQVLDSDNTRRCGPGVVAVVNQVFESDTKRGATVFRPHGSLAPAMTSAFQAQWPALTLYPVVTADNVRTEAQRCADTLSHWLSTGAIQGLREVMVLVQTHASALPLLAALREAGLPYSVKDQGERYQSVVWADTIALLSFLNTPSNTLALLQLLRSPLLGTSSAQLQTLVDAGAKVRVASAWETLQSLAAEGVAPWGEWCVLLQRWLDTAQALPLFETISQVVLDTQAPQRYLNAAPARQRVLFAEHWDWLKAWVLSLNKGRFPSLQAALDEAIRLQAYGGSDGDGQGGEQDVLRIFTVHSAKGLEANHVWLFDANRVGKHGGSKAGLLLDWPLGEPFARAVTVMANVDRPSPGRQQAFQQEQQAYMDEEDHVLYVALTRARHSLHVSGTEKKRSTDQAWFNRLKPQASVCLDVWPVEPDAQLGLFDQVQDETLPSPWVRVRSPKPQPLGFEVGRNVPRESSSQLRMGTAWHKALEHVDEGGADQPFEVWWANRLLDCEQVLWPLSRSELQDVRDACQRVLTHPDLHAWLKGAPHALNELEWVLKNGRSLRADRVVQLPSHHVVLDYKWEVNDLNRAQYRAQVLEYVRLVDLTLNVEAGLGATQAALIDHRGEIFWVTSV